MPRKLDKAITFTNLQAAGGYNTYTTDMVRIGSALRFTMTEGSIDINQLRNEEFEAYLGQRVSVTGNLVGYLSNFYSFVNFKDPVIS